MSRKRWHGDAESLAGVLAKHATSVSWLRHSEDRKHPKLDKAEILKHKSLIAELRDFQENLSFTDLVMQKAFRQVLATNDSALRLSPEQHKDWVQTMGVRLRIMLRHVAQAMAKTPTPFWATSLFEDNKEGDENDDKEGEEEEVAATSEAEQDDTNECDHNDDKQASSSGSWFVWYDPELEAACRCKPCQSKDDKQISSNIFAKPKANSTDSCWVRFEDGTEHELSDLTVERWSAKREVRSKDTIWDGTHLASKSQLKVAYRTDRGMLISLFQGGAQILQVSVAKFSDIVDDTTKTSEKLMTEIASLYAMGKLARDDIYKERERRMKELEQSGLVVTALRKKPGASTSKASAPLATPKAPTSATSKASAPPATPDPTSATSKASAPLATQAPTPKTSKTSAATSRAPASSSSASTKPSSSAMPKSSVLKRPAAGGTLRDVRSRASSPPPPAVRVDSDDLDDFEVHSMADDIFDLAECAFATGLEGE